MNDTTVPTAGQATSGDLAVLAESINGHHLACEAAMNSGLQHALEAGRLLLEAKGHCDRACSERVSQ